MIAIQEFRPGNMLLQKLANKISMVPCTPEHFAWASGPQAANLFPVVLKPELVERCGFVENMDYPLRPSAREFRLLLPIPGSHKHELAAYVKSNGECFARALVNDAAASVNVFQLHQLQNLHYALVGSELELKK